MAEDSLSQPANDVVDGSVERRQACSYTMWQWSPFFAISILAGVRLAGTTG